MIRTRMIPGVLLVGIPVNAVLRVQNVGDRACSNLVLEFELPPQVELHQGRRRIELERLGPDEQHDHPVQLCGLEPGRWILRVPNFSFRNGTGGSQRYRGHAMEIDVRLSGVVTPPPLPLPEPEVPRAPGSVFISYRRADARWVVGRLFDRLRRHFPREQIFIDSASIRPGEDFRRRLDAELESCAALLAVIGPGWLSAISPSGGRRLDSEADILRHEIAVALRREIHVVPVLFDARMPAASELPADIQALAARQSVTLDPDRFNAVVLDIVIALRSVVAPRR